MLSAPETVFTLGVFLFVLVYTLLLKQSPNLTQLGLRPNRLWTGWRSIILFTLATLILVQLLAPQLNLPEWVTDQDPLVPLILVVAAQEILFRGYLLNWLEFLGTQRALLLVTALFGAIHLVHASPWLMTLLSLIGGYVWGWHFYRHRNLYALIISHLCVNLSFNFFILTLI